MREWGRIWPDPRTEQSGPGITWLPTETGGRPEPPLDASGPSYCIDCGERSPAERCEGCPRKPKQRTPNYHDPVESAAGGAS